MSASIAIPPLSNAVTDAFISFHATITSRIQHTLPDPHIPSTCTVCFLGLSYFGTVLPWWLRVPSSMAVNSASPLRAGRFFRSPRVSRCAALGTAAMGASAVGRQLGHSLLSMAVFFCFPQRPLCLLPLSITVVLFRLSCRWRFTSHSFLPLPSTVFLTNHCKHRLLDYLTAPRR